jgi:hypothetical protein
VYRNGSCMIMRIAFIKLASLIPGEEIRSKMNNCKMAQVSIQRVLGSNRINEICFSGLLDRQKNPSHPRGDRNDFRFRSIMLIVAVENIFILTLYDNRLLAVAYFCDKSNAQLDDQQHTRVAWN